MVESCLPEELLIVWQRHPNYLKDGSKLTPPVTELSYLLEFLRIEVENEEQRKLAKAESSNPQKKSQRQKKGERDLPQEDVATSAGLFEGKEKCIFCSKANHQSQECLKALNMSMEEKRRKVQEAKGCYVCFRKRPKCNGSKFCKAPVRCSVCSKKHYHFMCPELASIRSAQTKTPKNEGQTSANEASTETTSGCSGIMCGSEVLLKTVLVNVLGKGGAKFKARLLFDEGSQHSYITSHMINKIQSIPVGQEWVRTVMIDGSTTASTQQNKHVVTLLGVGNDRQAKILLRERKVIGGILPRAQVDKWMEVLKKKSIIIQDHNEVDVDRHEVDILIGSDFREQLMTGRRSQIEDGIFAVESVFGWMLCGPVEETEMCACELVTHSYLTGDITQLWNLDVLGIKDTIEKASNEERESKMKRDFQSTVTREDGRYVVKLPFINEEVKTHLLTNEAVSIKRLETATVKLNKQGKFDAYNSVFRSWEDEGIIEVPAREFINSGHYLPHRPVFKESVTTPVRPVFDASCHQSKSPSLNQCLEKGPNWLELIPAILLRFREKKIGVISDIRKAFQMIVVAKEDRKFQRFFWWKDNSNAKELQVYQHCRVVFGMTCSPFILAAILELHLSQVKIEWKNTAEILHRSLYVDNCVASFNNLEEFNKFKKEATEMLAEAKMDLRQWETNMCNPELDGSVTKVLGLKWDKVEDTLFCQLPKEPVLQEVTKREVLSLVSQIYEPIGYACPALLQPKLMLQEAWSRDLGWDDIWEDEKQKEFMQWVEEIAFLAKIRIPRRAFRLSSAFAGTQFHVFTDASQLAYAATVFVRVDDGDRVSVQLLAAKSRVAPLNKKNQRKGTIPRLELMGCLIGARLYQSTKAALTIEEIDTHFWSDSATALAWIKREGDWGTFVGNRVNEIAKLTTVSAWKHIPGHLNPADLPSRGCTPKSLFESKWWEGPGWLKSPSSCWPQIQGVVDEDLVDAEKKKTSLIAVGTETSCPRFSTYLKNIRVAAWVRRFVANCKVRSEQRVKYPRLGKRELEIAEMDIMKAIQKRHLDKIPKSKNLNLENSEDGLVRVKTRLLYKSDTKSFKRPVFLPRFDPLVEQLIQHAHRVHCHAGTQFVLGKLREKYWIPQGRKTVGSVIQKCVICKRYKQQCLRPEAAPLPKDRIEAVFAFQKTGVDLAGPLILKGGGKAWIVLYTCAVYRGVHLDLITSLSTEAFLSSLERFINICGRSDRIFSDNGTNFMGAKNLMKILDWKKIEEEFDRKQIQWTFNPPASPWWGGWWERLVRSTKEMLRRMLGTAKLTYEELLTCIAAVAGTINDRPLTTLTEDSEDLIPLTPRMFMRDLPISGFPEGEEIGAKHLQGAYKNLQAIKEGLRARFRKEYLAMLVQKGTEKCSPKVKVGDVVLVGMDNKKRFEWPLARILELIPGRDGNVRVAKVKIGNKNRDVKDFSTTVLTRPLQRLYPLEMTSEDSECLEGPIKKVIKATCKTRPLKEEKDDDVVEEIPVTTRSGRQVNKPLRYDEWKF